MVSTGSSFSLDVTRDSTCALLPPGLGFWELSLELEKKQGPHLRLLSQGRDRLTCESTPTDLATRLMLKCGHA